MEILFVAALFFGLYAQFNGGWSRTWGEVRDSFRARASRWGSAVTTSGPGAHAVRVGAGVATAALAVPLGLYGFGKGWRARWREGVEHAGQRWGRPIEYDAEGNPIRHRTRVTVPERTTDAGPLAGVTVVGERGEVTLPPEPPEPPGGGAPIEDGRILYDTPATGRGAPTPPTATRVPLLRAVPEPPAPAGPVIPEGTTAMSIADAGTYSSITTTADQHRNRANQEIEDAGAGVQRCEAALTALENEYAAAQANHLGPGTLAAIQAAMEAQRHLLDAERARQSAAMHAGEAANGLHDYMVGTHSNLVDAHAAVGGEGGDEVVYTSA